MADFGLGELAMTAALDRSSVTVSAVSVFIQLVSQPVLDLMDSKVCPTMRDCLLGPLAGTLWRRVALPGRRPDPPLPPPLRYIS